jgi:Arc/MetJ-type ribon-helix-helix transcriptional regulator
MGFGMATVKVTVTLDESQVDAIRRLVAQRKSSSVSGFVKHAVGVSLADVAGWSSMLKDALARTGGPLTRDERAWAESVLRPRAKHKRKRRAA